MATAQRGWSRIFGLELLDDRYPVLHGLRVFGIVSVLQFHVTYLFDIGRLPVTPWGAATSYKVFFGMDLFFVLSGFLIGSILFHSVEKLGTLDVKRFYLRRVLRTFPPYYVVLTVLALTQHLSAGQRHNLVWEYAFLTNFRNLDPQSVVMPWGWSLGLEEQFYLTVPLFFWLLLRLHKPAARVAFLAVVFASGAGVRFAIWASRVAWSETDLRNGLYFSTHGRYDTLVAGILIALVHRQYGARMTTLLAHPRVRGFFLVGILCCLWFLMDPLLFGLRGVQPMHLFAWGTVTGIMYFLLVMLLLHGPRTVIGAVLSQPIFRRIATLGYGVYLAHVPICVHVAFPVARWASAKGTPMVVLWPLTVLGLFGLSLIAAYILHLLVERPMLRLRDRLTT
ncbi:acyltransferase [soil metagenome]